MAVNKRNIREVVDACYDMDGSEIGNSSLRTGWTDNLMAFYSPFVGTPSSLYNLFHSTQKDNSNTFPTQSQYQISINGGVTESILGSAQNGTGLKHLNHQMQSMKGFSLASGGDPAHLGGVFNGVGTYTNTNISMGDMRGFEYHTAFSGVWNSTAGSAEELYSSGEISVGSTS